MNKDALTVSQRDLWQLIDAAFDIMHPEVHRHHQQVSYLAYQMARALDLPAVHQFLTMEAAYLHDLGGAVDGQNVSLMDIENASYHAAQLSANILMDFPAFKTISVIVRYSQMPYRETRQLSVPPLRLPSIDKSELPEGISGMVEKWADITLQDPLFLSNLIQLADDVALVIKPDAPILNQVDKIMTAARRGAGDLYAPRAVEALEKLAGSERVWLELAYSSDRIADELIANREVNLETVKQAAKFIGMIIDFRSPFTAMHSAGVAASACALARLAGMNAQECDMMEIAGSLHDLGKIRTPSEILEKPGKLTPEEFNVMKALGPTPVKAPKTYWVEDDPEWFGAPFFVMEKCAGTTSTSDFLGDNVGEAARLRVCRELAEQIALLQIASQIMVYEGTREEDHRLS